mgnify:CR=1 FL=1
MAIRDMRSGDRHVVFENAREMASILYPRLKVDVAKIDKLLAEAVYAGGYAKVVTDEQNQAVGALVAKVAPNSWAQRSHAAIMLWYSHLPGGGVALLRDFRRWIGESRAIRAAGMVHDSDQMDPRMLVLADRVGFKREGGAYVFWN